jgi:hypothetical protein
MKSQLSPWKAFPSMTVSPWNASLSRKFLNEKLPAPRESRQGQNFHKQAHKPFDGDKKIHELFPPLDGVEFELQLVKQSQ